MLFRLPRGLALGVSKPLDLEAPHPVDPTVLEDALDLVLVLLRLLDPPSAAVLSLAAHWGNVGPSEGHDHVQRMAAAVSLRILRLRVPVCGPLAGEGLLQQTGGLQGLEDLLVLVHLLKGLVAERPQLPGVVPHPLELVRSAVLDRHLPLLPVPQRLKRALARIPDLRWPPREPRRFHPHQLPHVQFGEGQLADVHVNRSNVRRKR